MFDASELMPSSIGLAGIAPSVFIEKDDSLREKGGSSVNAAGHRRGASLHG